MADLYIPTYGRVYRQETYRALPPRWRDRTVLVARASEVDDLEDTYPGVRVVVCDAKGIAPTRQWILGHHMAGDRLLMLDDDLKFARRRTDDPTKFLPLTPGSEDIGVILDLLWDAMDDAHVVGLASRGGANRATEPWRLNQRLFDVMGLRVDTAAREGFRYRQAFMEDFDLQLQFLTHGYPTLMLNSFTKDDFGSNTSGGCSTYRDAYGQQLASLVLWENWPDFVSIRQVKADWERIGQRTDVTVQWSKAFKSGQRWREAGGLKPIPIPDWATESGLL